MDATEKIRREASRHGPLSGLAHDQRAEDVSERGGLGDHGRSLHGRERQRSFARDGTTNLLPGTSEDHGDDGRQGASYNYFSQTLLPDYIEEHGVDWNVVYDARGHFEEPHTNRRIGCGTIEVGNYLHAVKGPTIAGESFSDASVDVIGPSGGFSGVLFCEKEGFNPLFKAVNLANRYDLMVISMQGCKRHLCKAADR